MADEPTTPAAPTMDAPAPSEAAAATPQSDPTPAQVESKSLIKQASKDIDDLWAKVEGRPSTEAPTPESDPPPPETAPPPAADGRQRDANGRFTKAEAQPAPTIEAPPAETAAETPPPAADQATLEQRAYEQAKARIEQEQAATRAATERIEQEARFEQEVGYYAGLPSDRQAIADALEAANLGDMRLLDALDVTLPNGRKVSEVKADGKPGLSRDEAQQVAIAWRNADRYGDALSNRKVQQLIGYWDQQTQQALADPDVDAAAVRSFRTPGEQIKAAIDTTRAAVERRLGEKHATELAARDKTIAEQAQRIESLVNERGNLTSQQRAAQAATPDRPGQPGAMRRDVPTPDQLRDMTADEAFKSGAIDRVLQSLPGGISPLGRRRAG